MIVKCYLKLAKTKHGFKVGVNKTGVLTALKDTFPNKVAYPTIIIPLRIDIDEQFFLTETQNIKVVQEFVTKVVPVEETPDEEMQKNE